MSAVMFVCVVVLFWITLDVLPKKIGFYTALYSREIYCSSPDYSGDVLACIAHADRVKSLNDAHPRWAWN